MSALRPRAGSISMGGLTPLLDTLFVLLFALLAASEVRRTSEREEVRLRLPEVEPGPSVEPSGERRLVLVVEHEGSVRLEGGTATLATATELDSAVGAWLDGGVPEDVGVEVRADRDAPYGVAVELLQHLRLRGFVDVVLSAAASDDPERVFGGGGE